MIELIALYQQLAIQVMYEKVDSRQIRTGLARDKPTRVCTIRCLGKQFHRIWSPIEPSPATLNNTGYFYDKLSILPASGSRCYCSARNTAVRS